VAADGVAGGIERRGKRKHEKELKEQEIELESQRDERDFLQSVALANIRATGTPKPLTEAQQLDEEIKRLTLEGLRRKRKFMEPVPEDDLSPGQGSLDTAPEQPKDFDPNGENNNFSAPLTDVPAPDQYGNFEPALPLADNEDLPDVTPAPAADPKTSRKLSSDGRYEQVTFPDGSTQLKDLATGELVGSKTPPEAKPPAGYELKSVTLDTATGKQTYEAPAPAINADTETPEGMRLKTVRVDEKGKQSREFEPDTTEEELDRDLGRFKSSIDQASRTVADIDKIIEIAKGSTLPSVGRMSNWISKLPVDTAANDVRLLMNNVQADVAFKTLADMRQNSPTGGALGAVSEKELALLSAAEGAIDPSLSPDVFMRALERIRDARAELIETYQKKIGKVKAKASKEVPGEASAEGDPDADAIKKESDKLYKQLRNQAVGSEERKQTLAAIQQLSRQYYQATGKPLPRK
jgi:hypothetical protein